MLTMFALQIIFIFCCCVEWRYVKMFLPMDLGVDAYLYPSCFIRRYHGEAIIGESNSAHWTASVPTRRPIFGSVSEINSNVVCGVHKKEDRDDVPCYAATFSTSRRHWFQALLVGSVALPSLPNQAQATSQAAVSVQPGLEYLEPIYELQLSVTALAKKLDDEESWPVIKRRLANFLSGGRFSERSFYAALNTQYIDQIKYAVKPESKEDVQLDKEERLKYVETTLDKMEQLFRELAKTQPDSTAMKAIANTAIESMTRWMDFVPEEDRKAVADLYVASRLADLDHNGQLSEEELGKMKDSDRELWKKRIDVVS